MSFSSIAIVTVIAILQVVACSNETCSGASCIQSWFIKKEGCISCEPGYAIRDTVRYDKLTDDVLLISSCCMTFDQKNNITYVGSCPSNSLEKELENNLEAVVATT